MAETRQIETAETPRSIMTIGDVRPIPDPTQLTSSLVEAAKEELRREIHFSRQVVEGTQSALQARLDAMDKAIVLLQTVLDRLPNSMDERVKHLQALVDQKLVTHDEKFEGIKTQFKELDVRLEQGANAAKDAVATALQAAKEAVAAALQAAKELVAAQNIAGTNAIQKSEINTDKRIDETIRLLNSTASALDARIALLAESSKNTMTRQEVEQLFRTVSDKIDGPTGLAMRFEGLSARTITRDEQGQRGAQSQQWLIGAAIGGLALVMSFLAFLKN